MAGTAAARERLFALREAIARLEGKPAPAIEAARRETAAQADNMGQERAVERLRFDYPALDDALDGGLPLNALTEIRTSLLRDAGSAIGFVLGIIALMKQTSGNNRSLPILWITDRLSSLEAGFPYPIGIDQHFGIDPKQFFHAGARRVEEALWIAETALESGAFQATVLEVTGNPKMFGLTESRRLSLRAKAAGKPLFLLRQAGEEEAGSTVLRFLLAPAPSNLRTLPGGANLQGSIGNPFFHLTLEKSRNPARLVFFLEWSSHDHRFFAHRSPAIVQDEQTADSGRGLSASGDRQDLSPQVGSVVAFNRKA